MALYTEPPWCKIPSSSEDNEWYLIEIKSGMEVGKHRLHTRPCTVLGRAVDMVHIPIHHESASRQHARIAFDLQGIPWLKDLQSTHGTKCNKRPLPKEAIGKIESTSNKKGTRGVMLFPGDIIQFGASTRIFAVEGPSAFDRGAFKARQEAQIQKRKQAIETNQSSKLRGDGSDTTTSSSTDDNSVSWGISMEDDTHETLIQQSGNNNNKSIPMDIQVPEKHRKALEKLNTLKYKLSNVERENERIRRKGTLTDGQEKQLQRNDDIQRNLTTNIERLEEELYDKLYPTRTTNDGTKKRQSSLSSSQTENDEFEDDFFDRTKNVKHHTIVSDQESESTLIEKWKKVQSQQMHVLQTSLPRAEQKRDSLSKRFIHLQDAGDEEAFFVQNDLNLAKEAVTKIKERQQVLQNDMTEIEKLLTIVNPKISFDRTTGHIGAFSPPTKKLPPPSSSPSPSAKHNYLPEPKSAIPISDSTFNVTMLPPPARPKHFKNTKLDGTSTSSVNTSMPPPMAPPISRIVNKPIVTSTPSSLTAVPPATTNTTIPTTGTGNNAGRSLDPQVILPLPKRKRIIGPSMSSEPSSTMLPPPATSSVASAATAASSATTKGKGKTKSFPNRHIPQGTLAYILPSASTRDTAKESSRLSAPHGTGTTNSSTASNANNHNTIIDQKRDEWRAPEGQDGSGITKLNAKFHGRY